MSMTIQGSETTVDGAAKRRTVLVTGGAGYIGSHAVLALRDAGWPVVVIDNLSTGFRWAVPDDVSFVEGDVGDSPLVAKIILDHDVQAVMHFAGSIIVPESVQNPLKYYANNTTQSRSLIETALTTNVAHFLFSSTAAVYGNPQTPLVDETSVLKPINPYGMSKLMTEVMLRDVSAAHPMNYCALRYFNVAGADPQCRTGQATLGATHLIKVAVEAALGKREQVAVFGTDFDTRDGTGIRDYIHVSDLALAHVHALEKLVSAPTLNHVLNCGYGRGFSVLEVLDAVDRLAGLTVDRKLEGRRPGDPAVLVAQIEQIRTTLPWKPRYDDLDTIVQHALAWERHLSGRSTPRSLASSGSEKAREEVFRHA
ncbi:UDP-glucose 4-epimerase GalE (plasmid) [Novosphingobium sp. BL-8A]|uniref:UDP-glucose 4-epimerase GalE n=1 Tax=Novosphingobium sp. BL-8A TaxID=3127639 RepID=UPI003757E355